MKILITESQAELLKEWSSNIDLRSIEYDDLSDKLGTKDRVRVGNNTYLERLDEFTVGVRYHNTHIIKVDVTDTVTLDCDGWIDSITTSQRMNKLLYSIGFSILSVKGKRFLSKGRWNPTKLYPYRDGMSILASGEVIE